MRPQLIKSLCASLFLTSACADEPCLDAEAHAASGFAPGELVWEQLFEARTDDAALDLAVDRCTGELAVTGQLWTNEWQQTMDLWVARLDHQGTPRWDLFMHHRWDDVGSAVAFADDGSNIVAGTSEFGPYPGSAVRAGWLGRFDPEGRERWYLRLELDKYNTWFSALAVDGDRIYVASRHLHEHLWDESAFARAYDGDGKLLWVHEDIGLANPEAVFVLDDGDPLFVANPDKGILLLRLSPDGELRDRTSITEHWITAGAAALTPERELVMANSTNDSSILKLELDGTLVWELALDTDEHPYDLDVAADGAIYVAGYDGENNLVGRPWVAVLEPDGSRRWSTTLERTGIARTTAIGPFGDLFAAGHVEAAPAAPGEDNDDIWIARFAG
jgi:outer membrane protein assembly factor BamB